MFNFGMDGRWRYLSAKFALVRKIHSEQLACSGESSATWRLCVSIGTICLVCALSSSPARADAADQARRVTHFQWLQARGIFQSMGVVNGVPQLVLGPQRAKADNNAMAVFCKIIFDYFAESNPAVKNLVVIDSASGNQFATVDSSGFHIN
jgi:hypothetical protein